MNTAPSAHNHDPTRANGNSLHGLRPSNSVRKFPRRGADPATHLLLGPMLAIQSDLVGGISTPSTDLVLQLEEEERDLGIGLCNGKRGGSFR